MMFSWLGEPPVLFKGGSGFGGKLQGRGILVKTTLNFTPAVCRVVTATKCCHFLASLALS